MPHHKCARESFAIESGQGQQPHRQSTFSPKALENFCVSMEVTMSDFILARMLHVAGVVLWIGGVAFVTTVLIPALRNLPEAEQRLEWFERLENRFATQARIVTLLTGLSGFYMLHTLDAWDRYLSAEYWWVHAMTIVWLIFTLVLFVLEPLVLHRLFQKKARQNSTKAFKVIHRMHWLLLGISMLAIVGAVAGSRGVNLFGM
jgi:uncharacterized membrane protein